MHKLHAMDKTSTPRTRQDTEPHMALLVSCAGLARTVHIQYTPYMTVYLENPCQQFSLNIYIVLDNPSYVEAGVKMFISKAPVFMSSHN